MRVLRLLLPALLLALLVGLSACGDDDEEKNQARTAATTATTGGTSAEALADLKPEALEEGKLESAPAGAGDTVSLVPNEAELDVSAKRQTTKLTVRPGAAQNLNAGSEQGQSTTPNPPSGDKSQYDAFIKGLIPLISQFWAQETSKVSPKAKYEAPGRLASYTNRDDAPACHGDRSEDMSKNAFYCNVEGKPDECKTVSSNGVYCSGGDIVAWDEAGLMFPFYRDIGDLATGLVLAHEWGHLVQFRVYPDYFYETTIRRELQADCYAGAWAAEMARQGRVNVGEFNEALGLFYEIGGPGEAWLDADSHGNKYQRVRAFTEGFEENSTGCVGSKFDTVLKRIGLEPEKGEGGPSTTPTTTTGG